MPASKFSKNLRTRNMELVLATLEKLSRPGVHAEWSLKIVDGEIGDHQEVTLKLRPTKDALRERATSSTLDDLTVLSAE